MTNEATEAASGAAPITLTTKAADAILARAKRENAVGRTLRIFVEGGGCSGVSYKMEFDESAPLEGDVSFTQHGVSVAIDPKSLRFLAGSQLDYKAELMSQRFVWTNPNAKSSCGCGESFGV